MVFLPSKIQTDTPPFMLSCGSCFSWFKFFFHFRKKRPTTKDTNDTKKGAVIRGILYDPLNSLAWIRVHSRSLFPLVGAQESGATFGNSNWR